MVVAAIRWTGDIHSFVLSLFLFSPLPLLSLFLIFWRKRILLTSFHLRRVLYINALRFSSWRIVSRYLGENLESESPMWLMVNGLETIYPFRSHPRMTDPIESGSFSLSARAKLNVRYLSSCERALFDVMWAEFWVVVIESCSKVSIMSFKISSLPYLCPFIDNIWWKIYPLK